MSESEREARAQRILLIEDEPGLQEALALVLELEGYDVTRASDGREGLECLTIQRPDLIITDYMMPHMTGAEMVARIREQGDHANLPVLLMSAALPHTVDTSCADEFLQKPTTMAKLLDAVQRLLTQ